MPYKFPPTAPGITIPSCAFMKRKKVKMWLGVQNELEKKGRTIW